MECNGFIAPEPRRLSADVAQTQGPMLKSQQRPSRRRRGMKRIAFCNTILFGLAVCMAGGSSQAQDLRMVDAPTSQVRLAAPQALPTPPPEYDPGNLGYAVA